MTEQEGAAGALEGAREDTLDQSAATEPEHEAEATATEHGSEGVAVEEQQAETHEEQVEAVAQPAVESDEEVVAEEAAAEEAVAEEPVAEEAVAEEDDTAQAEAGEAAVTTELAEEDSEPIEAALVPAEETAAGKGKHSKASGKKRKGVKIGIGVAAVLVAAAGCLTGWMYADDSDRVQHVPDNTTLDGAVDISGMTHDEVVNIVKKRANLGYSSQTNLVVDGKSFTIKLSEVGNLDAEKTAEQAFAPYQDEIFLQRELRAMVSGEGDEAHNVTTVCEVDTSKLKSRVKKIAKKVDCKAQDAGYYYDSSKGMLVANKAKNGVKVDREATLKVLQEAMENPSGDQSVKAVAKIKKPAVQHSGQAIFVDTNSCQLYLYEDGDQVIQWPCSPGQAGYETPRGDWYLDYKDPSPTWYNPHAEWSVGMPDVWQPGYDNPLGLRALAVSCGDGIFIHGTINLAALGSRDSHGCVRLANDNIVELYDRVSTGIPIIIR